MRKDDPALHTLRRLAFTPAHALARMPGAAWISRRTAASIVRRRRSALMPAKGARQARAEYVAEHFLIPHDVADPTWGGARDAAP